MQRINLSDISNTVLRVPNINSSFKFHTVHNNSFQGRGLYTVAQCNCVCGVPMIQQFINDGKEVLELTVPFVIVADSGEYVVSRPSYGDELSVEAI